MNKDSFFFWHYNLSSLEKELAKEPNSKKFILLDENTYSNCLPLLIEEVESLCGAEILEIELGEGSKSLAIVEQICSAMIESSADKDSILISLGGGVITDLGGFIASVFKRGIKHIAIPTTLLGMVDASIGGKTGINLGEVKNQIGSFNKNTLTCFHYEFLESLDKRQILNGGAEMIKIALVKDEELWEKMKTNSPLDNDGFNKEFIERCILLKEEIVNQDPFEKGNRKILNFGHSLGHAFESIAISKGEDLLHGEAIASGIYYAIKLSEEKLSFPKQRAKEIYKFLNQYYKIIDLKENIDLLINYLIADKKNSNNEFKFVLLEDIGKPIINYTISKEDIFNL